MQPDQEARVKNTINEAVHRLVAGGIVVYPTETFFAIGCRADCAASVKRIFQIKKRLPDKPLPLILADKEQLSKVAIIPDMLLSDVEKLADFWPAPLTILLPSQHTLPSRLTASSGKIAVRVSTHPAARALAQGCDFPIVATSANISGHVPTTLCKTLSAELLSALDQRTDAVLDVLPPPAGGSPSTIAEPCGNRRLRIIRLGSFPLQRFKQAGFSLSET